MNTKVTAHNSIEKIYPMRGSFPVPAIILLLLVSSCKVKTNEKDVKKIVTITEHTVSYGDFDLIDSPHTLIYVKKYDKNGNVLEEHHYKGAERAYFEGWIHKYDDHGKRVKRYKINNAQQISLKYTYEHFPGKYITTEHLSFWKKQIDSYSYLDTAGNVVKMEAYDKDKKTTQILFKYNAAKQQTEQGGILNGSPMTRELTFYDEAGNMSGRKRIESNGNVVYEEHFSYEGETGRDKWKVRRCYTGKAMIGKRIARMEVEER